MGLCTGNGKLCDTALYMWLVCVPIIFSSVVLRSMQNACRLRRVVLSCLQAFSLLTFCAQLPCAENIVEASIRSVIYSAHEGKLRPGGNIRSGQWHVRVHSLLTCNLVLVGFVGLERLNTHYAVSLPPPASFVAGLV